MLDSSSRYIVANRINEERVAEARRAHLLRAAREDRDEFEVAASPTRAHGTNHVAGAIAAIRRGLTHGSATHAQGAAAR